MKIQGYLRWQFAGSLSSPSFWGFVMLCLATVAVLGGCPAPWPAIMAAIGFLIIMADAARSWFRFSYSIYEMEQKSIERELKRKSQ